MEKIDYKKKLKHLYQASAREVVQIDVPTIKYLMVDGEGDPNTSQAYSDAIEALFSVSYTVKFMVKKGALAIDYGVMPLEGLWWADDMSKFSSEDKSKLELDSDDHAAGICHQRNDRQCHCRSEKEEKPNCNFKSAL